MSLKITPARRAAFDVLWRVATEDAYAGALLASPRFDHLSAEDRALMQELALGTLRWQGQLDFLIEQYAKRKLGKLDPEVVIALRLGLYQLRFLSRIPDHAAINESVNLVKAQKKSSAAPLANAVLRAAARDPQTDLSIADPIERLSVETSHPVWLIRRWIARFGEAEARELALANNRAPRASFRFNPRIASEEQTRRWLDEQGIGIQPSSLAPSAAVVERGSLSAQSEPVRGGWIYLQDEASQLVAHLASNQNLESRISNLKFLDLCAAPGSKASLVAGLLPRATIVACDLHRHRLRTMRELGARSGATNLNLVQLDATRELPFAGEFDSILLDAPCSGLGTLQRQPEIKWRANEAKVRELAELQKRLIANAASQLRIGGLLTYSVCSTEPEEAEDVIAWFRSSHPEFRDITRERLTELGIDPAPLLTPSFGARTFPHRCHTEGFFFCTLWKRR